MASATIDVVAAVGSSGVGFISYVTYLPSSITAATAFSNLSAALGLPHMFEHHNT